MYLNVHIVLTVSYPNIIVRIVMHYFLVTSNLCIPILHIFCIRSMVIDRRRVHRA